MQKIIETLENCQDLKKFKQQAEVALKNPTAFPETCKYLEMYHNNYHSGSRQGKKLRLLAKDYLYKNLKKIKV